MIRPDTPPGTEVICIDAGAGPYGLVGLTKGSIYTVLAIAPAISGGYVAVLEEISLGQTYAPPWGLVSLGFDLRRFRYLNLPPELTRLLVETPQEVDV